MNSGSTITNSSLDLALANGGVRPDAFAPWCGIGVKGEWDDYRDALHAAQLDFTVWQEKTYWNNPIVPIAQIPGYPMGGMITQQPEELDLLVNVRDTDNKALGVVTRQYGVVQNEDAFALLEPFTQAGGIITNAGMTEQGLVFMVLRMQNKSFLGDSFDFDIMCTNSFNTMFPLALMIVPMRIYCQNMYRKLLRNNDMILKMRHGNQIDDRLAAANKAIGAIDGWISAFGNALEDSYNKQLSNAEIWALIEELFPYPKPGGPREIVSRERIDQMRQEYYDKYYMASDNHKYHNRGLGFLNAYYDYLSHRAPGKVMPGSWSDRRLSGLISGNDIKTHLIKEVL